VKPIVVSNRLIKVHFILKPGDFNVREFLEREKQVLQVQMVDGEDWTGLIKAYRFEYTVLKLERFLTLSMLMGFIPLMQSINCHIEYWWLGRPINC
jgi:hypothetical protein